MSVTDFTDERRAEEKSNQISAPEARIQGGKWEEAVSSAAEEVLIGVKMLQCDTYVKKKKGVSVYRVEAHVGMPFDSAVSGWADRVRQNSALSHVIKNSEEAEELIREWLEWTLMNNPEIRGHARQFDR